MDRSGRQEYRTALGYALLLAVPVGVGVSVGMMRATGGGAFHPFVFGGGILTAVVVFALVVLGGLTGEPAA
ncbi:MAG: hypothetical protein ACQETI_12220 [Halobacteriota archaeon]